MRRPFCFAEAVRIQELGGAQSLIEICPEVFDILDSNAQAEQSGRKMFLPGNGGSALHGGLNRAQAGGVLDELQPGADCVRSCGIAVNVE